MATTSLSLFQHYADADEPAMPYDTNAEEEGEELRDATIFEEKEVRAYAKYLGIKDHEYQDLRGLATEGLASDLPEDWQTCTTPDKGKRRFYHNTRSKRSQWEHPLDKVYKEKVEAARKETASSHHSLIKAQHKSQSRSRSRSHSPAVLGDVTNSKDHHKSSSNSKKRRDKSSSSKKKLLPPLRLTPIDVAVAATKDDADLNEQNPLYKEMSANKFAADSDSATSTISSSKTTESLSVRSKDDQKKLTSKQRRNKGTGNKRSPREMRIRERSKDHSRSSSRMAAATDSDSNSNSLSRSSKSWEGGIGNGANENAVDGHGVGSSHHSPSSSSSPCSASSLSPREPGDRLKKKKGSPRRIEKLNGLHGQVKLSPLPQAKAKKEEDDDGDRSKTMELSVVEKAAATMSKSKSKLLKHQELAEHHLEIGEAMDPVQLNIKIDIEEEETATKEDILSLRTLQQDTILELKQDVVTHMEDAFEKCVTKMGNELKESQNDLMSGFMKELSLARDNSSNNNNSAAAGFNQAAASTDKAKALEPQRMEHIKEEEASLLKQLKGEIDLISDYYDRDENAKRERDTVLMEKNKNLKISLEQECKSKLQLQESLEKATQQAEKDRDEMKARIENQKTEIDNLISRVSESSKDKFQMAENFNKSVVEQRGEMMRLLNRVWDKVKEEKEPKSTGVDQTQQMEETIRREFVSLSSALADQLAEKQKELVQCSHEVQEKENEKDSTSAMVEEITNPILRLVHEKHQNFLESFKSATHDERVAKKYSKKVTKEIKEQIELCIENKVAGKDIAPTLERIEAAQNEYRKSSSQALAQALEQYELCIGDKMDSIKGTLADDLTAQLEEKTKNQLDTYHESIHGMFEAVSSKIDDVAIDIDKEGQFLTKKDFESKLEETTSKLKEALEESVKSQRLLLETTLKEEKDRQSKTLISEACQTEQQAVGKTKAKKKIEKRVDVDVKQVASYSTPKGTFPSKSPLRECSSHSKKQIVLLRRAVETANAKQSKIKLATRKIKGNDNGKHSLLHNFETYVNGLKCSSESTRDIHKYLEEKGVW